MSQKTSKTLFYMKIMVCKIPPGGGGSETLSGQWPTGLAWKKTTSAMSPILMLTYLFVVLN